MIETKRWQQTTLRWVSTCAAVYCLSACLCVCVRAFSLKLSIGRLPSAFSPGGYNTQDNLIIYPGRFNYVKHPSRLPSETASAGGTRYFGWRASICMATLGCCCLMLLRNWFKSFSSSLGYRRSSADIVNFLLCNMIRNFRNLIRGLLL